MAAGAREFGAREERPFLGSEFPEEHYQAIRKLLIARRNFDLGWYKDRCIKRRIAIRVRACKLPDAQAYLHLLENDGEELDELLTTLTIHVSQFFRNPTTFSLVASLLPSLQAFSPLKCWSVGCASGEEAYSLSILLEEQGRSDVELLASDISEAVLTRARQGRYDSSRLANVPEEMRQKYFTQDGRWYIVKDRLRRQVSFRRHDILSDPYPQSDLILCRNVLIYFSRAEQERILGLFAAALPPEGVLVLGKAETMLGPVRERFRAIDHAERVYARREA